MRLIDADVLLERCKGSYLTKDDYLFEIRNAPTIQREWVGLSNEEVGMLSVFNGLTHITTPLLAKFIRTIEAKLKEVNGYD